MSLHEGIQKLADDLGCTYEEARALIEALDRGLAEEAYKDN